MGSHIKIPNGCCPESFTPCNYADKYYTKDCWCCTTDIEPAEGCLTYDPIAKEFDFFDRIKRKYTQEMPLI
jgi:hypothetical protein